MTSKDTKRFFSFEDVKQDELVFSWEPSQELYDELIEELNLVILKNTVLNGRFVTRKHGRLLKLQGSLKADVVQSCGITLEPIKTKITEELDCSFTREQDLNRWQLENVTEVNVSLDEQDPPDVIGPEGVDLFEVCREHLSLLIPPFPRKAELANQDALAVSTGPDLDSDKKPNPFAALAGLKEAGKKG